MADPPSERRATFDRLHADGADPWDVETSTYERDKRQQTIAVLGSRRFARGLEAGCSIGMLTASLAPICDRLLALDVSETALARARERLRAQPHVSFERGEVPAYWPAGSFDLIVFSEILYFLSAAEIRRASIAAERSLAADGVCLLVNWTGANDLPVDGQQAARLFLEGAGWRPLLHREEPSFRLDLLAH